MGWVERGVAADTQMLRGVIPVKVYSASLAASFLGLDSRSPSNLGLEGTRVMARFRGACAFLYSQILASHVDLDAGGGVANRPILLYPERAWAHRDRGPGRSRACFTGLGGRCGERVQGSAPAPLPGEAARSPRPSPPYLGQGRGGRGWGWSPTLQSTLTHRPHGPQTTQVCGKEARTQSQP